MKNLYFDHMASTKVSSDVQKLMLEVYQKFPGNVSSDHIYGHKLKPMLDLAESQVKAAVNGNNYQVVWTSGATEAINLAILGSYEFYKNQGKNAVTFATEHQATLMAFKRLSSLGCETKILPTNKSGIISKSSLMDNISHDTILVSICHVNNEIGTIQDINKIVLELQAHGCLVHIDAAQSIGKVKLELDSCPADFVSLSAHKFYGPQGIGALLIKPGRSIKPLLFGGQQQLSRPGTLPVALICGMGLAAEKAIIKPEIKIWQQELLDLFTEIGDISVHGSLTSRVANNLNINIAGVDADSFKLLNKNLAISSGSACNSQAVSPSHVLLALGYSNEHAANSIRISLGNDLGYADILQLKKQFMASIKHLRRLSCWKN